MASAKMLSRLCPLLDNVLGMIQSAYMASLFSTVTHWFLNKSCIKSWVKVKAFVNRENNIQMDLLVYHVRLYNIWWLVMRLCSIHWHLSPDRQMVLLADIDKRIDVLYVHQCTSWLPFMLATNYLLSASNPIHYWQWPQQLGRGTPEV